MTEVTNSAKHNYSNVRFRTVYHSAMYSNTIIWHHPRKCFEDGNICHRVVIFWVYDRVTNSAEHDWSSTVKFQIIYCSAMLRLPLFIIHGIKRCMQSLWQHMYLHLASDKNFIAGIDRSSHGFRKYYYDKAHGFRQLYFDQSRGFRPLSYDQSHGWRRLIYTFRQFYYDTRVWRHRVGWQHLSWSDESHPIEHSGYED